MPNFQGEGVFSRGESTEVGDAARDVIEEVTIESVNEEEFEMIRKRLDFSTSNQTSSFLLSMSSPRFKRVAAAAQRLIYSKSGSPDRPPSRTQKSAGSIAIRSFTDIVKEHESQQLSQEEIRSGSPLVEHRNRIAPELSIPEEIFVDTLTIDRAVEEE